MALARLSNQLPSLFDNFINNDFFGWPELNFSATDTTLPSVNIRESEEDFEVEVAAPGFEKTDFKIELNHDQLTISSEKQNYEEAAGGQEYTRREFSYQSFTRSFTLPSSVNDEKIAARYENGILRITIPKKEEARPKPPKQIPIV